MESKAPESQLQKLSPLDIKNKDFKKTAWGYAPKEVGDFLEMLSKTWDKAQRQEKEMLEKIRSLNEELTRWKNREVEIAKLREKTLQDCDGMKDQATREAQRVFSEVEERANEIRRKTEEWLEDVIAHVEETERQKMNFVTAFKSALDSHYALLQSEQSDSEPLGAKLNHFLKSTMAAHRA